MRDLRYSMKRVAPEVVRRFCERYKTDLTCANIFARRSITAPGEVRYYLENGLNWLHSPFLFKDMEEAVERILALKEEGGRIVIFGDRDADGVTSSALLGLELEGMGLDVVTMLPEGDEPYGISMDAVSRIIDAGASLVITVDNGVGAVDEVAALNDAGIDVIVTDHHIAGEELPDALAVIDPKVPGCGYPFEHLAGCGVASKFVWALRFAQTPLYKSHVILLHAEPGPGEDTTTIVQAVELYNLVETDRVVEELPNGAVDFSRSRLVRLLTRGLPIMVLDKDVELRQLRKAFGPGVDISLVDIRKELDAVIPRSRGRSLFELTTESRAALYADGHPEIEALLSLFTSCCIYKHPSLSRDYVKMLDLVAVGTVADMMPLVDENRILVRLGLKELGRMSRPSLIQLLSAQGLANHPITAHDIAWNISPVINSAGRLGCPSVALSLLKASDPQDCYDLTHKLLDLNKERQKLGDDAWQGARGKAKESLESFGSKFILLDIDTPRGLTGVLATRTLKENPQVPGVVVLSAEEDGRVSASMRSRGSLNCRDFLSLLKDHMLDFGGHKYAGGFSMAGESKEAFKACLEEEVMKMDYSIDEDELAVDSLISDADMNLNLIRTVELFEPYGEANPPLAFMHSGGKVVDIITLGDVSKGNIKVNVQIGKTVWPCLWWGARLDPGFDISIGDRLTIIFRMNRNYYRGVGNVQLTILQAKKMEGDA